MRLIGEDARNALADVWERWAQRCAELTAEQLATPTRCGGWDVAALLAHVCPDPAMFDMLEGTVIDEPPAVSDAAEMLRRFNQPDGIAHTTADTLAEQAIAGASALTPDSAAGRFRECARILRATRTSDDTVIAYPSVGSTTVAVITEAALMEATVHLLDLADAVGGIEPSLEALIATRDLLIAVPDATAAVEVLAGRRDPAAAVPSIR